MNAPIKRKRKNKRQDYAVSPDMSGAVIASLLFHFSVIILASVAFPYFVHDLDTEELAITVEMVDLADISQTNIVDKPNEAEEEKPEEPKPPPPEKKPTYNQSESPPDLLEPKPPEIEEPAEEIPMPPKPDEVKPDPPVKKPPPPKPQNKPKPPKPTPPKPEEENPKEPERDIDSLLKDVLEREDEEQQSSQPDLSDESAQQTSQLADFGSELTRRETDDLNAGVSRCWIVNAGGKYAETLIVSLRVYVNSDMTVRKVDIIDQYRYKSDPPFRAAADAAQRALLNPVCNKLRLPPEKYEEYKVFKYNFDPSDML